MERTAQMRKKINAYMVLVGKPEGKRPCIRPSCRQEDNIEMQYRNGISGYDLNFFGSGQGELADTCEHGHEPLGSIKYGEQEGLCSVELVICLVSKHFYVLLKKI